MFFETKIIEEGDIELNEDGQPTYLYPLPYVPFGYVMCWDGNSWGGWNTKRHPWGLPSKVRIPLLKGRFSAPTQFDSFVTRKDEFPYILQVRRGKLTGTMFITNHLFNFLLHKLTKGKLWRSSI